MKASACNRLSTAGSSDSGLSTGSIATRSIVPPRNACCSPNLSATTASIPAYCSARSDPADPAPAPPARFPRRGAAAGWPRRIQASARSISTTHGRSASALSLLSTPARKQASPPAVSFRPRPESPAAAAPRAASSSR